MTNEQKSFSLSHYFDELRKREEKKKETKSGVQRSSSFAARLSVIKSLMAADNNTLPFMALAKDSQLNLDACKEIIEGLQDEGLVEIDPDYATGNDRIRLTQEGKELL
jgi:predicted transcriptional regulator